MLLYPPGFHDTQPPLSSVSAHQPPRWSMGLCRECISSLRDSRRKVPPKMSVANGIAVIPLPPHLQPTTAELALLAKAISDFCFISLSSRRGYGPMGERQRALCGHVLHTISTGHEALWTGLADMLPVNTALLENFFVVRVGPKVMRSPLRASLTRT
eukprot:m.222097 g.222097  ORF g.222097 m.222097 type:complete len:157 (-) comp73430_c0_seq1:118-588(-)